MRWRLCCLIVCLYGLMLFAQSPESTDAHRLLGDAYAAWYTSGLEQRHQVDAAQARRIGESASQEIARVLKKGNTVTADEIAAMLNDQLDEAVQKKEFEQHQRDIDLVGMMPPMGLDLYNNYPPRNAREYLALNGILRMILIDTKHSSWLDGPDSPLTAVKANLEALLDQDMSAYRRTVIPSPQADKMPNQWVKRSEVEKQQYLANTQLNNFPTYLFQGKEIRWRQDLPVGTESIFTVHDYYVYQVLAGDGWKSDWRFSVRPDRISMIDRVCRSYLAALIAQEEEAIRNVVLPDKPIDHLLGYNRLPNAEAGHLVMLALEMILADPLPHDVFLLPDGKTWRFDDAQQDLNYRVGAYGGKKILFVLEKAEDGDWKVLPYDYLAILGNTTGMSRK